MTHKIDNLMGFNPFSSHHQHKADLKEASDLLARLSLQTDSLFSDRVDLNSRAAVGMTLVYQSISIQLSSSATAIDEKAVEETDEPVSVFDYEKVAENVMEFISTSIQAAKGRGASDDELNTMFEQARSGVNQGIDEAIGELKDLAMTDDSMLEDIEKSRSLISKGIDELEQQYFPAQPVSAQGSEGKNNLAIVENMVEFESSAYASTSNQSDLTITTADGDVVKISFSALQEHASSERYSAVNFSGGSAQSYEVNRASHSEMNFSYSVEGQLDEQEKEAIGALIKDINKLEKAFFNGNIEKAYEKALTLGYDDSEISGFSLDLVQTKTSMVSQKYTEVASLAEDKPSLMDKEILPLIDFIDQYKQLRESANELLNQELKQFDKLLDAVYKAEHVHDKHDKNHHGKEQSLLNHFKHFVKKFN